MKTLKIAVALLAVGILGSFLFRTPTEAASSGPIFNIGNVPLPVTDINAGKYTHVGQKASQLVALKFVHNEAANRIDLATGFEQPFEVPANFVFVLTDIHGNTVCNPGESVGYFLYQRTPNNAESVLRDLNWAPCNSINETGLIRHFTTGMPFIAGARVEMGFSSNSNISNKYWGEGYLVPAN
jgi:hypothetical protein